jgi:hypothetical protein
MKDKIPLLPGEYPIPKAPLVKIKDDTHCIPQHYLQFDHSVESVEHLVVDIEYSEHYPIFVSADISCIYLQVGIIGYDNYQPKSQQQGRKIVYGRKWRVEPQLPTSEIIQTAFLAILKAREHEVRELFRLVNDESVSSPFSNHHDLPLMANEPQLLKHSVSVEQHKDTHHWLQKQLDNVAYDLATFSVEEVTEYKNGRWIIDIDVKPHSETQLPELYHAEITLFLDHLSTNELYFTLMDALLDMSRRHVEENFKYKGFTRFSRQNDIAAIGQLSSLTRRRESLGYQSEFDQTFIDTNYETDRTRVPKLGNGPLSSKLREQLHRFNITDGILPE